MGSFFQKVARPLHLGICQSSDLAVSSYRQAETRIRVAVEPETSGSWRDTSFHGSFYLLALLFWADADRFYVPINISRSA